MPKRIAVDLVDLAMAFDMHLNEGHNYLDLQTGAIVYVMRDTDDDELPVPRDEFEESERFLLIEPRDSHEG